jgi:hypothetical protein
MSQMRKSDSSEVVVGLGKRMEEAERERMEEIRTAGLTKSSVEVEWVAEECDEIKRSLVNDGIHGEQYRIMGHLGDEGRIAEKKELNSSREKRLIKQGVNVDSAAKSKGDE